MTRAVASLHLSDPADGAGQHKLVQKSVGDIKGSAGAKAPLTVGGVGIETDGKIEGGGSSTTEVEKAWTEFGSNGENTYFSHWHDIQL